METHKYDTLRIRKQEAVKFEKIREKDIAIDKKHNDSRLQAARDEKERKKVEIKKREDDKKERNAQAKLDSIAIREDRIADREKSKIIGNALYDKPTSVLNTRRQHKPKQFKDFESEDEEAMEATTPTPAVKPSSMRRKILQISKDSPIHGLDSMDEKTPDSPIFGLDSLVASPRSLTDEQRTKNNEAREKRRSLTQKIKNSPINIDARKYLKNNGFSKYTN